MPESYPAAPDALLCAEVIRSWHQDAILPQLHTDGGHGEAERLHSIDLPVRDLWQQVDKPLALVADNCYTRGYSRGFFMSSSITTCPPAINCPRMSRKTSLARSCKYFIIISETLYGTVLL
jgi:hypothetical protein